jgi:hypothetical protein
MPSISLPTRFRCCFAVYLVSLIGVLVLHALAWLFRRLNCKLLSPSEVKLSVRCSHIVCSHIVVLILLWLSSGTHVEVACSRTPRCQFGVL